MSRNKNLCHGPGYHKCSKISNNFLFYSKIKGRLIIAGIHIMLGPNKKICVLQVTGLKFLGWVGTHFFFWEKYNLMHFERHFLTFKMHKIIYFFSRKPEKSSRFHQ